MSKNNPIEPKPCIEGGIPPCPRCPVQEQCNPPGLLSVKEQDRKRYVWKKEEHE